MLKIIRSNGQDVDPRHAFASSIEQQREGQIEQLEATVEKLIEVVAKLCTKMMQSGLFTKDDVRDIIENWNFIVTEE